MLSHLIFIFQIHHLNLQENRGLGFQVMCPLSALLPSPHPSYISWPKSYISPFLKFPRPPCPPPYISTAKAKDTGGQLETKDFTRNWSLLNKVLHKWNLTPPRRQSPAQHGNKWTDPGARRRKRVKGKEGHETEWDCGSRPVRVRSPEQGRLRSCNFVVQKSTKNKLKN